jgi:hypothetical protein
MRISSNYLLALLPYIYVSNKLVYVSTEKFGAKCDSSRSEMNFDINAKRSGRKDSFCLSSKA